MGLPMVSNYKSLLFLLLFTPVVLTAKKVEIELQSGSSVSGEVLKKTSRAEIEQQMERATLLEKEGLFTDELQGALNSAHQQLLAIKQEKQDYRAELEAACLAAISTNELDVLEVAYKEAYEGKSIWGDLVVLDNNPAVLKKAENALKRLRMERDIGQSITSAIQSDERQALEECVNTLQSLRKISEDIPARIIDNGEFCKSRIKEMNAEQQACRVGQD